VRVAPDTGPRIGEPKNNPSDRRDGIVITFWCEQCHGESGPDTNYLRLAVIQHKGATYLRWLSGNPRSGS
jgi:hypothetical protein